MPLGVTLQGYFNDKRTIFYKNGNNGNISQYLF